MNDKTGGRRGLRRAGILAVVAAVAVLATGCDVVHVHFGGSGSAEPATYRAELAYAQCMRAHGPAGLPLAQSIGQPRHEHAPEREARRPRGAGY